jgi:hypothetical protein
MSDNKKIAFPQELSSKLGVVSVVSILLVLFNHSRLDSQNGVDFGGQIESLKFVNDLVAAMTRLNRVLFFSIAGFLFAYGAPFGGESFLKKLKNRFRTIFVPYFCSFFLTALGVAIAIWYVDDEFVSRSPTLSSIVKVDDKWFQMLVNIRLKVGFHLWFIESLMINVCAVGLFFQITRWSIIAHSVFLVSSILWFVFTGDHYVEGLLYFVFGSLLGRNAWLLEYKDRRFPVLLFKLISWGFLIALYLQGDGFSFRYAFPVVRILQAVLGASIVWQAVDFVPLSLVPRFAPFAAYTFPIYLLHAPFVLGVIRHAYVQFMPFSSFSYSCAWFVIAIIAYFASYLLARTLESAFPRLSALVFGGRGAARNVK